MESLPAKLHVLVDSREASVSFARNYFSRSRLTCLGVVEHIRPTTFADRFAHLLTQSSPHDEILIALLYLAKRHLYQALSLTAGSHNNDRKITLATYCFPHVQQWCTMSGWQFVAITAQKRANPSTLLTIKKSTDQQPHYNDSPEMEQLKRIWVQYRLMLAIISRSSRLGEICRRLILEEPAAGDTIEREYDRALRYFRLGEPDMAGGSYACEKAPAVNPIDALRLRINRIAVTDFNVLIKGESGSGKDTIAWAIHELSSRRDNPFLVINCAGLPDELLESEMFGYQKGSHNQAYTDSPGLLRSAHGGTLFLDELPDMSPRIQAKLLRFIESGEYRPLGSTENLYADTRIIAAGQPGRLNGPNGIRADLKSRISQLDIEIVPLRRIEKISPGTIYKIAFILLERYTWSTIFEKNKIRELTPIDIKEFQDRLALPHHLEALSGQEWKESNIRELNNFLRQWIVFGDNEFKRLTDQVKVPSPSVEIPGMSPCHDSALAQFLIEPKNRRELKQLFANKPLHHLKKSYLRHLFAIYTRIVEEENLNSDRPTRPTQKELARLMGVTENTISRHLS